MNFDQLMQKLRADGFHILETKEIPYGMQVRLGCGATINVYKKGTVLVKGKFIASVRAESIAMLEPILPPHTKWYAQ